MRALVLLTLVRFLAVVMLCGVVPGASDAGEPPDIKVKNGRTVSLQVVDVPLNEVLNILAKNIPMEIRGTVPSQERITVNFSDLTLEEALSRIMRGYNYVLVRPDESAKALLVVMNRIDRAVQSESASFAPAAGGLFSPPAPCQPKVALRGQASSRPHLDRVKSRPSRWPGQPEPDRPARSGPSINKVFRALSHQALSLQPALLHHFLACRLVRVHYLLVQPQVRVHHLPSRRGPSRDFPSSRSGQPAARPAGYKRTSANTACPISTAPAADS